MVNVVDEVRFVIAKELKIPIEQLNDDTKFEALGADSVDLIEIVFALEEKFDINISVNFNEALADSANAETSIMRTATVGELCRAVQALMEAKTGQ